MARRHKFNKDSSPPDKSSGLPGTGWKHSLASVDVGDTIWYKVTIAGTKLQLPVQTEGVHSRRVPTWDKSHVGKVGVTLHSHVP